MTSPRPPRLAEWLLERVLFAPDREAILGDLAEQYGRRRRRAALWYWGQLVTCLRPSIRRRHAAALRRDHDRRGRKRVFDDLRRDIGFGARQLIARPGFTTAALLTLMLGIGANTAIFSVVHGVILRPLGYQAPERIVSVWPTMWFSKDLFEQLSARQRSFASVAVYTNNAYVLTGDGASQLLEGPQVTADFFGVLGVPAQLGRTLGPGDDRPGADPVAVISHGLWQRSLGASPDVLRRSLNLDGTLYRIVGVMPASFDFLQPGADVAVPLVLDPAGSDYSSARYLRGIARLDDGVNAGQAHEEMGAVAQQWRAAYGWSEAFTQSATVVALHDQLVGGVRRPLYLLLGAVGLMLIVACANVANLLIARGLSRRREMAVRRALGASRRRIVRQLVTEGALLGLLGGVGGVLFAGLAGPAIRRLLPPETPRLDAVGLDGAALAVAGALSVLSCLLFALVPALQIASGDLRSALPSGGASGATDRRGARLRRTLVFSETALAAVLLITAGLLTRSLWRLQHVDLGFDPSDKIGFNLVLRHADYDEDGRAWRVHRLVSDRMALISGVGGAGAIHSAPVIGGGWNTGVVLEGAAADPATRPFSFWRVATQSYLAALGVPLMRGRYFTDEDRQGAPGVVIVNQTAADTWWPGEDPVGKRLRLTFEPSEEWLLVVGVVADVRILGAGAEPPPTAYRPLAQAYPGLERVGTIGMWHVVRMAGALDAGVYVAMRDVVRQIDPNAVVVNLARLPASIGSTLAEPRSLALLLLVFAASSVLLGAIGLYGLVAYRVAERTREIGLRMAMGAAGGRIVRLVVREGAALALGGVFAGLMVAVIAGRAVQSLLFEVDVHDPLVFATVGVLLAVVAVLASLLPALRAAGINPVRALRDG